MDDLLQHCSEPSFLREEEGEGGVAGGGRKREGSE